TAEKKALAKECIVFPLHWTLCGVRRGHMVRRTKLRNCEICDKCCGFCNSDENARLLTEPGALLPADSAIRECGRRSRPERPATLRARRRGVVSSATRQPSRDWCSIRRRSSAPR